MPPNPSVNADAPVHAGDLANRGAGAPVTLIVRRQELRRRSRKTLRSWQLAALLEGPIAVPPVGEYSIAVQRNRYLRMTALRGQASAF